MLLLQFLAFILLSNGNPSCGLFSLLVQILLPLAIKDVVSLLLFGMNSRASERAGLFFRCCTDASLFIYGLLFLGVLNSAKQLQSKLIMIISTTEEKKNFIYNLFSAEFVGLNFGRTRRAPPTHTSPYEFQKLSKRRIFGVSPAKPELGSCCLIEILQKTICLPLPRNLRRCRRHPKPETMGLAQRH